ncbi:DNA-binding response regulator [Paenalkalicoccus suaedae]|uniref:DNA-binding response regulator n=1 Tax=Paenalkalicoccus suaedae TaxID=2592382 RepID=A0A859FHE5_9BACI|nr:DNA-binding response regulator [Paenalkalicoccus suaedae]QKS72557.1 DNA-binding response regulator [Paenalkalicoccus suaedae]
MPNMTGIELLETCKYRTNQLSIILSSYDEFDYAKQAMKLGAFDYLLKPLNHEELSATLKKAVTHLDESGSVGKKSEKAEWFFANDAKPSSISNSIKRVLDFIDENFAEKLTVQELADHIDKSPTYLHGKFKKEMNQTLSQYINKVRIQKSIEQMRNGEDHIYSIAQSVGYSDYKYFTTVFKKYTNHSPTSFIKSLQL